MRRHAVWFILLLAFIGLSDSAYLANETGSGGPLICNFDSLTDCNVVAQSPYSNIFGIPIAWYGVGFYILVFILAAIEARYRSVKIRYLIQGLSVFGLLASAYFILVQIWFIQALCIYCVISSGIVLLIFALAYFIEPLRFSRAILKESSRTRLPLSMPPPLS